MLHPEKNHMAELVERLPNCQRVAGLAVRTVRDLWPIHRNWLALYFD
jgi:hypothetical protein